MCQPYSGAVNTGCPIALSQGHVPSWQRQRRYFQTLAGTGRSDDRMPTGETRKHTCACTQEAVVQTPGRMQSGGWPLALCASSVKCCTVSTKGKGRGKSHLSRTCPLTPASAAPSAHPLRWAQDPGLTACGHLPSVSQRVPQRTYHHPPHTCSSLCAPTPRLGPPPSLQPGVSRMLRPLAKSSGSACLDSPASPTAAAAAANSVQAAL